MESASFVCLMPVESAYVAPYTVYSLPCPHASHACLQVMDEIVYRTAHGMAAEGMPFRGTLFAGLMIKDGKVRHPPCLEASGTWRHLMLAA